jgi:Zn-dependent peptidase ImmA (M78 family)
VALPLRPEYFREYVREIFDECGIKQPPVDLERVGEYCFDLIYVRKFSLSEVEAIILPYRNRGYAIVNSNRPEADCRFTLAHQYYHFITDYHPLVRREGKVRPWSWRETGRDEEKARTEVEANLFATELLVPTFMLEKHFHAHYSARDVAYAFHVSREVAQLAINLSTVRDDRLLEFFFE